MSDVALPPELAGHPHYRVERELGRGGMGVVYLARNLPLDRPEVLKVIARDLLAKPDARDRFVREMRSAAKLSHPNIVTAYAAVTDGDFLALAMEYVTGESLDDRVCTRGPLPVREAAGYAYQAAVGLQHAHEKGMVHRDIKPSNLMVTGDGPGVVKVLDFGLAKATREKSDGRGLTASGAMLGTPDYMAPEQILDAAAADTRADIYSLGCTLYHLLTGEPPFHGGSLYAVLYAHQNAPPPDPRDVRPDVPPELAAVLARMMAKQPGDRYPTPAAVAAALLPFAGPAPAVAARRSSAPTVAPGRTATVVVAPPVRSAQPDEFAGLTDPVGRPAESRDEAGTKPRLPGWAVGAAVGGLAFVAAALYFATRDPAAAPATAADRRSAKASPPVRPKPPVQKLPSVAAEPDPPPPSPTPAPPTPTAPTPGASTPATPPPSPNPPADPPAPRPSFPLPAAPPPAMKPVDPIHATIVAGKVKLPDLAGAQRVPKPVYEWEKANGLSPSLRFHRDFNANEAYEFAGRFTSAKGECWWGLTVGDRKLGCVSLLFSNTGKYSAGAWVKNSDRGEVSKPSPEIPKRSDGTHRAVSSGVDQKNTMVVVRRSGHLELYANGVAVRPRIPIPEKLGTELRIEWYVTTQDTYPLFDQPQVFDVSAFETPFYKRR